MGEYARPLGRDPGKYQRFLTAQLSYGQVEEQLYTLRAPGQGRHDLSRSEIDLPLAPLHELADAALRDDPTLRTRLREMQEGNELPPAYTDSPVVRDCPPGELAMPWGVFMDGVQYSNADSVVGSWL